MKSYTLALIGILLLTSGCMTSRRSASSGPVVLTEIQRAALQTKEIDGSFKVAMSATVSVLQDRGWQIDTVEHDVGVIQASSLRRQDVLGPHDDWRLADDPDLRGDLLKAFKKGKEYRGQPVALWTRWEQLTVHAEPWGTDKVRMRVSITKHGRSAGSSTGAPPAEVSLVVDTPHHYQDLYQRIQKAVFVRANLSG